MSKITLSKAVRYPFGSRAVHPSGTVLEVNAEDEARLHEMGVIRIDKPAQVEPAVNQPVAEVSQAEEPAEKRFPPVPKKTAGVNVWREYARDNEIDVRGLSEKSELVGHIMKVAGN